MSVHRRVVLVAMFLLASRVAALAQDACPSFNVADVLKDPRVQETLDDAWRDSHEGAPDEHEEGAWVYQCRMSNGDGTYRYYTDVRPWPHGTVDGIHPSQPRPDGSCRLVAEFHTHPGGGPTDNPGHDGPDNWEPSGEDRRGSAESGLPGIIRFGSGDHTTDFTYGYNGMTEPRDPSWHCPGSDANFSWGFGDPHVKTLDGYTFDFQAIGNFTYLTSTRGDLELQVQQQPYRSLAHAAVNSAVAVRDGNDRVEWSIDRTESLLNGVVRPMVEGDDVRLQSRGIIRRTPDGFLFISSVGDRLTVVVSGEMVDFYLRPAPHRRGQVRGLLGNFDGNPDNDMETSDGRAVVFASGGVVDASHPLYSSFGASWRASPANAMMTRPLSTTLDVQRFPAREPEVNDAALAAATLRCAAVGATDASVRDNCAFDVVATGGDAFMASAGRASREADRLAAAAAQIINVGTDVTGTLDGREARAVFAIRLARGAYVFDGAGSERTTWTLAAPDGGVLIDALQGRSMPKEPQRITVPVGGVYTLTVTVSFEMLDGVFRFRVRPAALP